MEEKEEKEGEEAFGLSTYDITLGKIKGKHSAKQTKKKRKQTADSDKSLIIHISHFILIFLSPSLRRSSASMGARACAG